MKRVLVPLDGTKNAEAAIPTLARLCEPGDEVVLLKVDRSESPQRGGYRPGVSVMQPIAGSAGAVPSVATPDVPFYVETGDQAIQRQLDEAKDYLEDLAGRLRATGQKVETVALISDNPDVAIIDYARAMKPSFIAMLRRTHPGFAEMILGSVATSVMRADVAPVLFVPPGS
jgi:nucleotide-binding universal stress UspA family protein